MTRIAIIDDQKIVREGLALIIKNFGDMNVAFNSDDGNKLIHSLNDGMQLDVVLLDVRMRGMDGIAVMVRLKETHPTLPVLFLTSVEDPILLEQGMGLGARGWLSKHCSADELKNAIIAVGNGRYWRPQRSHTALEMFTARELQIVRALAAGRSNTEIADHLALSNGTVKNYVSIIYEKLSVSHRGQAIARLRDLGLDA
ncbi:MAG: response regulator transcription factor [Alcanivoracaceae bacterium]|nr:response regulator transcription factor [Alcanivoracaceae bacterium]